MIGPIQVGSEPIPGYRLVERLGSGGYGDVWKAEAPGGINVALKFVPIGGAGPNNPELRAFEVVRNIRHPHLLDIQFATQVGNRLVIATSLCDKSLSDRLKECQADGLSGIPPGELLGYMWETAVAIDFLNEPRHHLPGEPPAGIQHRDLKPNNLFLVGGSVKVGDFGLAKLVSKAAASHTIGRYTPAFAAPEMFRGTISPQSDQYSIGVTYCMLRTGKLPFESKTALDLLKSRFNAQPDLGMLPEPERKVIARALAIEPNDRWSSCKDLVLQLRDALTSESIVVPSLGWDTSTTILRHALPTPASGFDRQLSGRGIPGWQLGIGGGLVAAVGVLGLLLFFRQDDPKPAAPTKTSVTSANPIAAQVTSSPADPATSRDDPQVSLPVATSKRPETFLLLEVEPETAQISVSGKGASLLDRDGERMVRVVDPDATSTVALTISHDGFEPKRLSIIPKAGKEEIIRVSLEPLPPMPALLVLSVDPPDAQVTIKGEAKVEAIGREHEITVERPDGKQSLEIAVARDGYHSAREFWKPAVAARDRRQIKLEALPFVVKVSIDPPDASIELAEGKAEITGKGSSRLMTFGAPNGDSATVLAMKDGYLEERRQVTLKPGVTQSLSFKLKPIAPAVYVLSLKPADATVEVVGEHAELVRQNERLQVVVKRPDLRKPVTLRVARDGYEPLDHRIEPRANDGTKDIPLELTTTGNPEIGNTIGMKLVLIPPGRFQMGSVESTEDLVKAFGGKDNFDNERPAHPVQITRPFYLSRHEVRVREFTRFVEEDGYKSEAEQDPANAGHFSGREFRADNKAGTWKNPGFFQDQEHPVVCVSWNDAIEFCRWLSKREDVTYRLPTEAEWEHACRAGSSTLFFNGDEPKNLVQVANVPDTAYRDAIEREGKSLSLTICEGNDGFPYTAPVANFPTNRFGLYDMHGNVWEWCQDAYDADYYRLRFVTDPKGPPGGSGNVVRGGCFQSPLAFQRSAARGFGPTKMAAGNVGFRVVRESD